MGYANTDGKVTSSVPDYLDALQLSHDPFEARPVEEGAFAAAERVFYSGGQREKILDQVAHLSQFSASVVVVAGELGSGRTTLKDMLCLQLEEHCRVADIAAAELTPPEQIFSQLAALLDCEVFSEASPGELMSAIRSELLQLQHERGDTLLLLLDDAQLLSDAVLSALLSLLQAADPEEGLPFQMVMFGDMELIDRLDSFGMMDILLHDVVLPSLTEDEMADYLACRLEAAGWEGELPFTETEVERLCGLAQGVPGAVHQAARELLIDKAAQELESGYSGYSGYVSSDHGGDDGGEHSPDRHPERDPEARASGGLPVAHIFSLVVLVGVLLMAFFYKDSWLGADDEVTERQIPLSSSVLNTADTDVASGTVSRDSGARGGSRGTGTSISLPIGQDSLLTAESAAADDTPRAQPATRSEAPPRERAASSPVTQPAATSPTASPASASTAPASSPQSSVAEQAASTPSPAATAPATPPAPAPAPATQQSALSADERYLLGLSAEGYILQVMASSSQAAVETYLSRQTNRQALRLYATTRAGKPWFVVVTGSYSTVEMARAGIQSLPAEQKKAGPWPRKVADIQAQIKAFRDS